MEAFARSPLAKWKAWRTPAGRCPQGEFLRAMGTSRRVVFRSGNRVGKTEGGAVAAALLSTGWHPWARIPAPNHGWISCLSWDFVRDIIWPAVSRVLPKQKILNVSWRKGGRSGKPTPDVVVLKNGSTITFKTSEQGREKYQGARLDWAWADEEQEAGVIEELRTRLIDTGGLFYATLTPIMRYRWVRELESEPGTVVIRASMWEAAEAGILPMEEVKAFAARLPERQRRVRVHGDQAALEGLVYSSFSRETHCAKVVGDRLVLGEVSWPWPLPPSWQRRAAMDFGFSKPSAVPIACGDPFHRRLIVYRCPYAAGIRATKWAKHLNRVMPKLCRPLVCDHDAFARAELEAGYTDGQGEFVPGHRTVAANKEVVTGIEAVERLLEPVGDGAPGLVLVLNGELDDELGLIDAEKLAWEMELYHYPEQKLDRPDVKDAPVKKDDHACDGLRYMVKDWERWRGGPPRPPRTTRPVRRRSGPLIDWPADRDPDEEDAWER